MSLAGYLKLLVTEEKFMLIQNIFMNYLRHIPLVDSTNQEKN